MWVELVGAVLEIVGVGWGSEPSPRRIAKDRARGRIAAPTRTLSGKVPGVRPFWEAEPEWTVDAGVMRVGRHVLEAPTIDAGSRVPTSVEQQMVGTAADVLTVRSAAAVLEIALGGEDQVWFRERFAGATAPGPLRP